MDTKNFTIKSQEAIQKAQELAMIGQQQAIETGHILKALFVVDEDIVAYALKKVNANTQRITQALDGILQSYPKVSGAGSQYLSNASKQTILKANSLSQRF